jgi:spore germination protein GerM
MIKKVKFIYPLLVLILICAGVLFFANSSIRSVILPFNEIKKQAKSVDIYFSNTKKDPAMLDCSAVFPVARLAAAGKEPMRSALEALLAGPDDGEKAQGNFSSINSGVEINLLEIRDGVVFADFSDILEKGVAGSCRVIAIRSQIEHTLYPFSPSGKVVISINGRTEDILQP